MSKRDEKKEHYSYLYEDKYDGLEECYQPTLKEAYEAGWEAADEHPANPWHVKETDGDPEKSMHVLVNLDGVYLACDYDKDKSEWWCCDGYISGYAPDGRPLYSSKTKLNEREVAAIRTYMQLPNEPH